MEDYRKEEAYLRARLRTEKLKKFYSHLGTYVILFFALHSFKVVRRVGAGHDFLDVLSELSIGSFWWYWAIGLLIHAASVFLPNVIFGPKWEAQKMKEYMDKEKNNF
ncbi:MAG: hypothetical protein BM564_09860 [Bacteroidetes bacterium MedPE-SWsnd-G2]|nr:MAG: hypothetical protein BM564_09860 [Bacteroidetes bacterium MedPE-SWsnd-G2]